MLQPFVQGQNGTDRRREGAGLGLAIAHSLCRILGCELTIADAEGRGTMVSIEMGAPPPAAGARALPDAPGDDASATTFATLLDTVVNSSPLAIVVYDHDWTVRVWNDAAARMFGWQPEEVIGRPLPFVSDEEEDRLRELLRRALEWGEVTSEPVRRLCRDGRTLEVETSIAPMRDGAGHLLGFVSMLSDVSERNRLEEQLRQAQKMEVVGRLAGGIAHDFNNLLTVIQACAELLRDELPAGDHRRLDVDEIRAAAARAASLTRQLLVFARQEVAQRRLLDVRAVVSDVESMLRRLMGSHIELAVLVAPEPCRVVADPGQLEQVVMNLVINARDAMPRGGEIVVEVGPVPVPAGAPAADGGWIALTVSDTGTGMDEATRARIFEPFFTTKAPGQGTGLGLATVYAIVTGSGGRIHVESEPERGTTIRVLLPCAAAGSDADHAALRAANAAGGSETVLLAEDQDAVRSVAARILRARGYTVLTARHGRDALDLAARHDGPIHALVTDLVMPEMDGHTLAARLRERIRGLCVVYISGYSEEVVVADADAGAGEGGVELVQKPFSSEELACALRRALDRGR